MTLWKLYDDARQEVTANLDAAINEAYILKLEERIEKLENQVDELTRDLDDARRLSDKLPF